MVRSYILLGSVSAFLAVALGAFGAHALKAHLTATHMTEVYQTGVHYQMTHALALLLLALLAARPLSEGAAALGRYPEPGETTLPAVAPSILRGVGALFMVGTFLFSGSLYALALSSVRIFGAITPFGGLCFLAGWALLAYGALRRPGA